MKYIQRELERKFIKCSNNFKAVLVTGARQVGKTTMLKHLAEKQNRTYVSLDNYNVRQLAKSDPALFFQTYEPPIILDEVQKAPELFEEIKIICDSTDKKGLFWLTGSQQYSMMKHVSESLAGRIVILKMYPLSQRELAGHLFESPISFELKNLIERTRHFKNTNIKEVFEFIWKGGMPATQDMDIETRSEYFSSYVETYLMRDAIEAGNISDTLLFSKFITACAALTSSQVNYAKLAEVCEISQPTAKKWLNILVGLGIVHLLQPYENNSLKRLSKTPKLYFTDTGLCANLTHWTTAESLMDGAFSGAIFENYVVNEFLKMYAYSNISANLTSLRNSNSYEIDLLIEQDNEVHPIEIKKSSNPKAGHYFESVAIAKDAFIRGRGGIVCMSKEVLPINQQDCLIPCNII